MALHDLNFNHSVEKQNLSTAAEIWKSGSCTKDCVQKDGFEAKLFIHSLSILPSAKEFVFSEGPSQFIDI